jgi:hypothetical protein
VTSVHLFGSSTSTGNAFSLFLEQSDIDCTVYSYSRKSSASSNFFYADLSKPNSVSFPVNFYSDSSYLVSFAPIWILAEFLDFKSRYQPDFFTNISGIIATSSSSSLTKRFSFNHFDKDLARRLYSSESMISGLALEFGFACHILQPSLIYGSVGAISDQNLSRIIGFLRRFPVLPFPDLSGKRQPIHASQLAQIAISLLKTQLSLSRSNGFVERIPVGGDIELSYLDMIRSLQASLPSVDSGRNCLLLPVSNRLFYLFVLPVYLFSPKLFEALFRINADLSGFAKFSDFVIDSSPSRFPYPDI